jgi:Zn-dependent M28 family amino/carboxypeptidase
MPLSPGRDLLTSLTHEGTVDFDRAPLVFVGFGIDAPELGWRHYEGADVRGKVVVMLYNDPDYDRPEGPFGGRARSAHAQGKAQKAFDRGASGVLTIHQVGASGRLWKAYSNRDSDATYRLASAPAPAGPARLSMNLSEEAGRRLMARAGLSFDKLEAAAKRPGFRAVVIPGSTLSMDVTATARPFTTRNILARIDGTSRADETVIFGAHWDAYGIGPADEKGDTIRNGAVDNAIGTATLLEVARAFAKGPKPKRTLLFIGYTAEEDGLLGAYHYTANPVRPLATTAAVFNLDPHLALPKVRSMELIGAGRSELEDDLAAVAAAQGLGIEPEALPDEQWYRRSDHFAFARAGVPTVYFRAGRNLVDGGSARGTAMVADYDRNRYHQRDDVFDPRWDLAAAAQEGAVVYALGRRVADSGRWPDWRSTPDAAEFAAERAKTAASRR